MKRIVTILSMVVVIASLSSCSKEQRAKNWGGSYTYKLPPNEKLLGVTWKESDLWILKRKMHKGEVADTSVFLQDKGGVLNLSGDGQITFVETKTK